MKKNEVMKNQNGMRNEKEMYVTPKVELIRFECEDVITTSLEDGYQGIFDPQQTPLP